MNGTGTVNFTMDANPAGSPARNSVITLAQGATFNISQDAGPAATCSYTLVPTSQSVPNAGGSYGFQVQTTAACSWQPADGDSFVHLQSTASMNGTGTVNFTMDANPAGSPARNSVITLAQGATFNISQDAGPAATCSYTLVPTSQSVPNAGGSYGFQVQTTAACSWQPADGDSFVHLQSTASMNGTGTVNFTMDANPAGSPARNSVITLAQGATFNISQDAGPAATCSYTLVPTSQSVPNAGGSYGFQVQTTAACSWQPADGDSFVHLQSTASMNGTGTVNFTMDANPAGSPARNSVITLAQGATFNISQDAGPAATCSYTLVPTSQSVPNAGGSYGFQVQTTAACSWQPADGDSFVHLQSTASMNGTGTVNFTMDANPAGSPARNSVITLAQGATFNISQDAGPAATCSYTLVPTSQSVPNAGGSYGFQVQTTAACSWQPADGDSFVHLQSTASMNGTGTVNFTMDANPAGSPARNSVITLAQGATFNISQDAGPAATCSYTLVPTSQSVPNAGGSYGFQVQTTAACSWQPADGDSFVHLQSTASMNGTGTVNFTVDANPAGSPARNSAITVAQGATFNISQDAGPAATCSYTLAPTSQSVPNAGGSYSFQVQTTAACSWQPADGDSFVHLQSTAAITGPGSVSFTVDANSAGAAGRNSSITVAQGVTFTISQAPGPVAGCNYSLSPTSQSFPSSGGISSFQVQTTAACSWQPSDSDSFVQLQSTAAVTGPGTVNFTVAANPAGAAARNSSITVAQGVTFTISQAAGPV